MPRARRDLTLAVLAALALLALSCAAAAPKDKPAAPSSPRAATAADAPPLKLGGIYRAEARDGNGADVGWNYLRFFKDGTVLAVSSRAPVERVLLWMQPGSERCSVGTYEDGPALRFSMKSPAGTVDYEGAREGAGLSLKWHSNVNGADGTGRYEYVEIGDEPTPEPAPPATAPPVAGAPAAPPPPDESLKPDGTGWSCFDAPKIHSSRCERTRKECARARLDAQKGPVKLGKCHDQNQAFCHTVKELGSGEGVALCYSRQSDCETGLASMRAADNASSYAMSDCVAW